MPFTTKDSIRLMIKNNRRRAGEMRDDAEREMDSARQELFNGTTQNVPIAQFNIKLVTAAKSAQAKIAHALQAAEEAKMLDELANNLEAALNLDEEAQ